MDRLKRWSNELGPPSQGDGARPEMILEFSLCGFLGAIALTGVAGLVTIRDVHDITERTLEIDVDLEDEADDLRAAILDLGHFDRDLFDGPNQPGSRLNLELAHAQLVEQLDDYAQIDFEPIPGISTPAEMLSLVERIRTLGLDRGVIIVPWCEEFAVEVADQGSGIRRETFHVFSSDVASSIKYGADTRQAQVCDGNRQDHHRCPSGSN